MRRGDWADKTGGLALPVTPLLRDTRRWFTRNRRKELRIERDTRKRFPKQNNRNLIVRSLSAKYRPDRYRRDKSVKFGTELP